MIGSDSLRHTYEQLCEVQGQSSLSREIRRKRSFGLAAFAVSTLMLTANCGASKTSADIDAKSDPIADSSPPDAEPPATTLAGHRKRLLRTYFDHLVANPTQTHSNGLSGQTVRSICDVWTRLSPSDREVFLQITGRLWGAVSGSDDSRALAHITKVYRIAGGEGATPINPGSCGGAEFNRLMMSMDMQLHDAFVRANDLRSDPDTNGKHAISDVPSGGKWRNTSDAAGPHDPFSESDDTADGAPRAQAHYFRDVASADAQKPLGRTDLTELVDPLALEVDQDYNCTHDSNPLCSYTTYGRLCFPGSAKSGVQLYNENYGNYEADWQPVCQ